MNNRTEILNSLVDSANKQQQTEGLLGKAAAIAIGGALAAKLFGPKKAAKKANLTDLAKALQTAKTEQQTVAAITGVLAVAASVLLRIPELRDLGFRVQQIVDSDRLQEF